MRKWLLGNPQKAFRDSYIWNMIASAVNAAEAVIVLMVATRTVGLDMSGTLTIAFTVANLMMCIGKYGVRNYQVTDVKNEYTFSDYYKVRWITLGFLCIGLIIFMFHAIAFSGYSLEKVSIVLMVTFIYAIEAYEDVFLSALQHNNRLDIGAKMFSLRWIVTLLFWCITLIFTKNAIASTFVALGIDLFLVIYLTRIVRDVVLQNGIKERKDSIKEILIKCLPLCISAFTAIYLPNASKYAIDRWLSDSDQAYYGFISMPIFVIDIVSVVIFQPLLVKMSEDWNYANYSKFARRIIKLCGLVIGVSIVVLMAGYWFGIPVLSIVYGVNLSEYKQELMILLIGGSALGFIGLFTSVLTIIRRQRYLMWSYVLLSIVAVITLNRIVMAYGLHGAAVANTVLLLVLMLALMIGSLIFINKAYKSNI